MRPRRGLFVLCGQQSVSEHSFARPFVLSLSVMNNDGLLGGTGRPPRALVDVVEAEPRTRRQS